MFAGIAAGRLGAGLLDGATGAGNALPPASLVLP